MLWTLYILISRQQIEISGWIKKGFQWCNLLHFLNGFWWENFWYMFTILTWKIDEISFVYLTFQMITIVDCHDLKFPRIKSFFLAMRLTRYVRDWDFFEKNFSFARSFILLKLLLVRGGKIWYGCWTIYNFDLFLAAMSITGSCK